jgi:hypothetical protein
MPSPPPWLTLPGMALTARALSPASPRSCPQRQHAGLARPTNPPHTGIPLGGRESRHA